MREDLDDWLADFLARNGGVSGTVHLYESGGLRLASAANIPEKVRQIVAWVPYGKGMAGLALERGVPVETCNLKEDDSGAVKPGAKAVDAQARPGSDVVAEQPASVRSGKTWQQLAGEARA